jgi:hypothetical protein
MVGLMAAWTAERMVDSMADSMAAKRADSTVV